MYQDPIKVLDAKDPERNNLMVIIIVYVYSRVPNKRPGRLLFLSLYAFGTVIISGTLIFFFYPF